ncbi:MAG: iron chaperone [Clostridiales bacterium 38-18]|nr:MAG: iron chaperone [Clostridiales bacterium 38-18]
MRPFDVYLDKIDNPEQKERMIMILDHIKDTFPNLIEEVKWNQPMFTDHGTFIVGFSMSKMHIAMSPETKTLELFEDEIKTAGYAKTKMLLKLPWASPVNFELIDKMIAFNIEDKKEMTNFWRVGTR